MVAKKRKPAKKPVKKKRSKKATPVASKAAPAAPPAPPKPSVMHETPEQLQRKAGRAERAAKREAERVGPQLVLPAAVASSVASIDDARKKRGDLEKAFAKEIKKHEPIHLEMDEAIMFKLLHLGTVREKEMARVRKPFMDACVATIEKEMAKIKGRLMKQLKKQIDKAVETDEDYIVAENDHTVAINAAIDTYEPKLPKDYSVIELQPENKIVRGVFAPAERGNRLPLRELKKA